MTEITTLTTFTLAAGETLPPHGPNDYLEPERWEKVMRPLAKAPGYSGGVLGPSIEDAKKVMIITAWESSEHLAEFASSAEGQSYQSELAAKSQDQPYAVGVYFLDTDMRLRQHGMCKATIEVHTIDFPKGCRESIAEKMTVVRGMQYMQYTQPFGGLANAKPKYHAMSDTIGSPISGWVVQQALGQTNVDQAVWIHFWKSPEREEHFKRTEVRTMSGVLPGVIRDDDGVAERVWPIEEFFEEKLRQLGALRIVKEHFELKHFPYME
ncbi:hypothetical protein LTR08_007054 [Meristemomyces frigidus]|nr:hypothetical protein LTR08_007054 [Meristemomyces frigidus]